ncbi:MAG: cysteine hydrolase [Desulfobacterales bacterium]|nr:cysteine hydrolase [Desulfobacterales bacterium]
MNYIAPELNKSALITIDTQCDFTLPGAPAEIPGTTDVIPNMKRLLQKYRQAALPIIHIVRLYLPDGSNADICRREMIESGKRIVCPGTIGAELVEDLKPSKNHRLDSELLLKGKVQDWGNNEYVICKPRWGAFFKTPLEEHLKNLDINTLVFCGCNFPNCPRTSIYQASERDFRIVLVQDAVSGIYEQGRNEMNNIGVFSWDTRMLIEKLNIDE